jgi:hypothetical protein
MGDMIDRAALLAEVDAMIAAAEGVAEVEKLNGLNLGAAIITATTRDVRAVIAALPPAQPDAVEALVKAAYDEALRVIGEGQELTVTADGSDVDWRYRSRVARADALNAAMARVMLARDAALAAIRGGAE